MFNLYYQTISFRWISFVSISAIGKRDSVSVFVFERHRKPYCIKIIIHQITVLLQDLFRIIFYFFTFPNMVLAAYAFQLPYGFQTRLILKKNDRIFPCDRSLSVYHRSFFEKILPAKSEIFGSHPNPCGRAAGKTPYIHVVSLPSTLTVPSSATVTTALKG